MFRVLITDTRANPQRNYLIWLKSYVNDCNQINSNTEFVII